MRTRSKLGWIGVGVAVVCAIAFFNGLVGGILAAAIGGWAIAVFARSTRPAILATIFRAPTTSRGAHLASAAGELLVAIAVVACAVTGADMRSERAEKERQRVTQELLEANRRVAEARDADLRGHARDAVDRTSRAVAEIKQRIENGEYSVAARSLSDAKTLVAKYKGLNPPVAEMATLSVRIADEERDLTTIAKVKEALQSGPAKFADAALKVKSKDYIEADKVYRDLLADLDVSEGAAVYLPMADVQSLKTSIENKRRALSSGLKRQKAEIVADELHEKLCGEQPKLSAWDGEVIGLERHIKETANDPDSIDAEKCTVPRLTDKYCWVSTCNVRGKNAFGALILLRKTYSFSTLGIEEVR